MQLNEEMLQAEIEFWRYMIESRRGTVSEQATERMLNACELAERKLMMMENTSSFNETRQWTGEWNGTIGNEKYHAIGRCRLFDRHRCQSQDDDLTQANQIWFGGTR